MSMINVTEEMAEFKVMTTDWIPEEGDKWEDERNIYTITRVERLYLSTLPLYTTQYYLVNVDVFAKDICNPDEPERFMFKFDPSKFDSSL